MSGVAVYLPDPMWMYTCSTASLSPGSLDSPCRLSGMGSESSAEVDVECSAVEADQDMEEQENGYPVRFRCPQFEPVLAPGVALVKLLRESILIPCGVSELLIMSHAADYIPSSP